MCSQYSASSRCGSVLTGVLIGSVRLLVRVLDKPVKDPSHEGRDQSHACLCACNSLGEGGGPEWDGRREGEGGRKQKERREG